MVCQLMFDTKPVFALAVAVICALRKINQRF